MSGTCKGSSFSRFSCIAILKKISDRTSSMPMCSSVSPFAFNVVIRRDLPPGLSGSELLLLETCPKRLH